MTSRDPELDLLVVLAFARETACRREGILNLDVDDLHPAPSVVLYEKFEEQREIPISASLRAALQAHAGNRSVGSGMVFRYPDGSPLTGWRFDTIFSRVSRTLPWAKSLRVSLHWIRYSTLTDIRMTSGKRLPPPTPATATGRGGGITAHTRASFAELQEAHSRLFGVQA